MKKTFCISLLFGLFVSCESIYHVQGVILDADTKKTMDSVIISCDNSIWHYTDSTGYFSFTGMGGYIWFRNNRIPLLFEKAGYKSVFRRLHRNDGKPVVIFMEKD